MLVSSATVEILVPTVFVPPDLSPRVPHPWIASNCAEMVLLMLENNVMEAPRVPTAFVILGSNPSPLLLPHVLPYVVME